MADPFDLDIYTIADDVLALIPIELREKHRVIPIYRDGSTLAVAMADPGDLRLIDELRFVAQRNVVGVEASEAWIDRALERHSPVPDLKPHVETASCSNPSSIENLVIAMFYRSIWIEARFITLDNVGVSVWREQCWKLEAGISRDIREAMIRQIRALSETYGWNEGDTGAYRQGTPRGSFGYFFRVRRDEHGTCMLLEQLARAEWEARVEAELVEPELPTASPYR